MTSRQLYESPGLYGRIFPADAEDAAFFAALMRLESRMGALEGPVLDAACGTGALTGLLGLPVVGLDRCRELLRVAPAGVRAVAGDLLALPFASTSLAGAFSRLFGYGYAAGERPEQARALAAELGRILRPGAPVALEVPLAYRPDRLQGMEEHATLPGGLGYRFRYLDVLQETAFGAVLASRIEVTAPAGESWMLAAPLHVYTPEGMCGWLGEAGVMAVRFHAPYDPGSGTAEPPADCLRAIAAGTRK